MLYITWFQRINVKTGYESDDPISFVDVYKEFNDVIAEKYKIMKFKSLVSAFM